MLQVVLTHLNSLVIYQYVLMKDKKELVIYICHVNIVQLYLRYYVWLLFCSMIFMTLMN